MSLMPLTSLKHGGMRQVKAPPNKRLSSLFNEAAIFVQGISLKMATAGQCRLDKKHGFFREITRNQEDRKNYHEKREREIKEIKSRVENDMKTEKTSMGKQTKNEKRKPDKVLYIPPSQRTKDKKTHKTMSKEVDKRSFIYQVEVSPGKIAEIKVTPSTCVAQAVDQLCEEREVEEDIKWAIRQDLRSKMDDYSF